MGSADKRFRRNLERAQRHAKAHNAKMVGGKMTDEMRQKFIGLVNEPKYRNEIEQFAIACRQWRQYNPDVALEWHDTSGMLVSGDPSVDHVRRYLAKNDAAANLIQYADEATGKVCSLMQVQMALVGLGWIS